MDYIQNLINLAATAKNMMVVTSLISDASNHYLNEFIAEKGPRNKSVQSQQDYITEYLSKYNEEIEDAKSKILENIPKRLKTTRMYYLLLVQTPPKNILTQTSPKKPAGRPPKGKSTKVPFSARLDEEVVNIIRSQTNQAEFIENLVRSAYLDFS